MHLQKTLPSFCRNGSVHFSCVSLFMNTLVQKKKRNAAGGREEEMKFVRYQQNYPQYKIIICNFFSRSHKIINSAARFIRYC